MRADAVLSPLFARWTAYTLKRAIADVAATSDQAYRDFGLDRDEILRALRCLRAEIEGRPATAARPRPGCKLAIAVCKRAAHPAGLAA